VERRSGERHAEPADLDQRIGSRRQPRHAVAPQREGLGRAGAVIADAEQPADMVEDDRRVGKGGGEVGELADLRMEDPGVERQAERCEPRESSAEAGVGEQARRRPARPIVEQRIVVPIGRLADAAEAALAGVDMRLQDRRHRVAQLQVGVADDARAKPR
jgi:hypothetical protein